MQWLDDKSVKIQAVDVEFREIFIQQVCVLQRKSKNFDLPNSDIYLALQIISKIPLSVRSINTY
jgi:hypothetical protein